MQLLASVAAAGLLVGLVAEAKALMVAKEDSVIFYALRDERYLERSVLGEEPGEPGRFL